MKRVLIIFLTIGFILNFGCTKFLKPSTQVDLTTNKTDVVNNNDITNAENVNLFFFKNNESQLSYKGNFLFDDVIEKEVKLSINKMADLKHGKLYELKLDSIAGVPNKRLSLGYFYVQKDKIYKIELTEEDLSKFKTGEELPNGSVIVCQDDEIKDTLGKDKLGWHHYLEVDGNKRKYHSYNNQVSSGYYESFIWERSKGLVNYWSGYGAERDSIKLQINNEH